VDRSFNGQYYVSKTLVFATSFDGRENTRYSWQNLLQKPSQVDEVGVILIGKERQLPQQVASRDRFPRQ
jgi:hypothetical protein